MRQQSGEADGRSSDREHQAGADAEASLRGPVVAEDDAEGRVPKGLPEPPVPTRRMREEHERA